jgi:hypothetical protein
VLRAALRRFATLVAAAGVAAALLGLLVAALPGESFRRGLAIGFYVSGVGLCALAFLLATRPPVRSKGEGGFLGIGRWTGGGVRFATRAERDESINLPAIFVSIGVLLIVAGALVDSRHGLA